MPGQLFYSLNIPEEKGPETVEFGKQLRAIVTVTEGRGTRFRISEELNYLVGSEVNWEVKRLSTNEFMITVPSIQVLNLLQRMGTIKFTCFDIQATVQETDRDPESFHMLQAVWVKAEGILKIAKKEIHVMELAYLVGDPEEVFLESLEWKEVWVKVWVKELDPKKIAGTPEVYINKQGHKITWSVADKGPTKSQKPAAKSKDNDDDATDEDEPESQDSYGLDNDWLKSGTPPAQGGSKAAKKKLTPLIRRRWARNTNTQIRFCRGRCQ